MPIRDAARKSKPRQGVLQLRLHDARVTASWASSLPSNPPEVPSASPRSWLSPGPRPARSSSRSTCPSVRDPRVTERCVPSLLGFVLRRWPRASPGHAASLSRRRVRPPRPVISRAMPRAGSPPLPRLSRGDRRTGASTLNGEETKHARLARATRSNLLLSLDLPLASPNADPNHLTCPSRAFLIRR